MGYIETGNRPFCKNSVVNALLNAKYNQASEQNIDCFFSISMTFRTLAGLVQICFASSSLDTVLRL